MAPTGATVLLARGDRHGQGAVRVADSRPEPATRTRPWSASTARPFRRALIESELFGREKGAYTGALSRQAGRFEVADKSTLFLDEIGDLPLEMQIKLLRVLQERQIERLGSSKPINVDMRIVAATNRDLEKGIAQGTFREDLYYRLNVFPIRVPPLRERTDDIPILVWSFVDEFCKAFGKPIESISKDSMLALQRYHVAGERPRAAQRRRARRDCCHWTALDDRLAEVVGAAASRIRASRSSTWSGTTSLRCSSA